MANRRDAITIGHPYEHDFLQYSAFQSFLTPDASPKVKVSINGFNCYVTLDTGAERCLVSKALIDACELDIHPLTYKGIMCTASGHPAKLVGESLVHMVAFGLEMEFWVLVTEHPCEDLFLISFPFMNALDIIIDTGNLLAVCYLSLKHAKTMTFNFSINSYTFGGLSAFESKINKKPHMYAKAKTDDSLKVKGRLEALQFARNRLSPDLPPVVSSCSQLEATSMVATTFEQLALSSESEAGYSSRRTSRANG